MAYDKSNIFARILRGEIPCKKVHEDAHTLAFHDIQPKAPVHVLVIPRGEYESWDDFHEKASDAEQAALSRAVGQVARLTGVAATGYRVIANCGRDGRQEVAHFHLHVLGGRSLGRMVGKAEG